jgi:hypothetical protein
LHHFYYVPTPFIYRYPRDPGKCFLDIEASPSRRGRTRFGDFLVVAHRPAIQDAGSRGAKRLDGILYAPDDFCARRWASWLCGNCDGANQFGNLERAGTQIVEDTPPLSQQGDSNVRLLEKASVLLFQEITPRNGQIGTECDQIFHLLPHRCWLACLRCRQLADGLDTIPVVALEKRFGHELVLRSVSIMPCGEQAAKIGARRAGGIRLLCRGAA